MPELSRPLPAEDRLVLLPKNPGSFFVFWLFSAGRAEAFASGAFAGELELRLACVDDGAQASVLKAGWQAGRAYLPVPAQGKTYQASLYALRGDAWEKLLESNQAAAPAAAGMAEERAYASMEFHKKVLS
ncbi:MAG: hypothetical protein A2X31_05840 [Elusimicrobia bacterium GWB2_63_22]|nr:MAG: hypothetical protein A2X31_05840 [Elusimicrobia bacterium GWB2_63_22]